MDPNSNLNRQIDLAQAILHQDWTEDDGFENARELAELVKALDEWIRKGGFYPKRWEDSRK